MATMWRSNADMYVTVPFNKVLFSVLYSFITSQSEVDFGIALVVINVS
jgi:thymidylate synthase